MRGLIGSMSVESGLTSNTAACCAQGVLILAEVALGTPYEALDAEDLSYELLKASRNCDSTFGMGRMGPPAEHHETMYVLYHRVYSPHPVPSELSRTLSMLCRDGGAVVPIGEFEPTGVDGTLMYNEYVVYRQEQVKLRYIVVLDFDYDV